MVRAYYLYTGDNGHSHVTPGQIDVKHVIAATSIQFKEDPPHSTSSWHNDPTPQYVFFLAGALEFSTKLGETFTVQPGEVLIAVDHTGTGHTWKIVNDQPWIRAYVIFQPRRRSPFRCGLDLFWDKRRMGRAWVSAATGALFLRRAHRDSIHA